MTPPFRIASLLIFTAILCAAQESGGVPPPQQPADAGASPANPPARRPVAPEAGTTPAAEPAPEAGKGATEKAPSENQSYVLGTNDLVDVRVWNDQKLSGFYAVGPDGTISMLLIGTVKADGLTIAQLTDTIKKKLTEFYNDPEVNIQLSRINSKRYYVYGGVNRPGEFPLTEKTTIMDAIASWGGFTAFANSKKIRIMRGNKTFNFNYKDVSRGKNMEQNIVLQNGDRIFVPGE